MDIERLIHHDDSDQSDHGPFVGVVYSPAPHSQRAVARERPKRPRKPSNASLRAQVEAFEFVVKHLPYVLRDLDDPSARSEEDDSSTTDDEDAQRMRLFLKRTISLTKEAQEELAKRTEYLRMLKRHYEGTANLRKLMRGLELDGWFWMCERWRTLARKHYVPLPASQCYAVLHETLEAITAHELRERTKESRLDFFGWQDWHQLDADQRYVRFMTRKTLMNTDMEQVVDNTWALYSDGDLYKQAHLGDNCDFFLQVLQKISPDVMILQYVEKYPNLEQLTHTLEIAFRVKTETGYMIVSRSIESPRLQSMLKADGLSLSGNFFWDTFEVAHRDAQGQCDAVQFTLTGSIGSDNPTYAKRWHDEVLNSLVRSETQYADRTVLTIEASVESSTEENVVSDSQDTP